MSKVTTGMTYQKGSWTLHMLRQLMGDDQFWTGIREYYARFQNKNASTTDFRLAMERASGLDLSAFFQQWLYRGGVPKVEGSWQWDARAKQLVVELAQTQPGEPFRLPVEIDIRLPGARPRTERMDLTTRSARFVFAVDQEPMGLEFDPNVKLLVDGQLSRLVKRD
jgi:aminopeptidase N